MLFLILKGCNGLGDDRVQGEKTWFQLCIGSDYEGVINPQDIFFYPEILRELETKLVRFVNVRATTS